ncbi:tRNA isopentenyl-2-thiomethyl-A-37 hydroxylase MiaE [Colwellia sp. 4_MG-2023]|uniref:tRNA isopentenyl-2-thiomethyl-A-37 hydroxylase MiaE n=1 Tax=unclassified Colwellia TaxID=196834 RepID=UPI0026E2ED34|nr:MULTISPECIES: tRNA isopentenyl-2-thiomethyl-A-37 hydroxylase MiaE [unclassified Colwellia]MDO6508685.1 tRNA isopentenyl-2-thiomethyl-A-37 hydroxylase MiaE [Colwellia sp. 5_MG-2023]MDO6557343.1 tRNA isopentenyl-2-thiomethyl-A-37 hydroxylase MiaE [Colwellia sp. 4_MG-2023]
MTIEELLSPIQSFLQCETPQEWIDKAAKPENLSVILLDHLVCELKAAQTGMWLIRKYAVDKQSGQELLNWLEPYEKFIYKKEGTLENLASKLKFSKSIVPKSNSPIGQDLIDKMVLLIKEELHHFYQVLEIMNARNIPYENISAGRYAKGMMKHVKTHEPETLIDKLICGAYIEARSCERFAKLAPYLDDELNKFYISLLRSEARHYEDYLSLAQKVANEDISERVKLFGKVEAELILSDDKDFKFHSGIPK